AGSARALQTLAPRRVAVRGAASGQAGYERTASRFCDWHGAAGSTGRSVMEDGSLSEWWQCGHHYLPRRQSGGNQVRKEFFVARWQALQEIVIPSTRCWREGSVLHNVVEQQIPRCARDDNPMGHL